MTKQIEHVGSCTGGNTIPLDDEGRAYHFGCKADECANYILIVSCYKLAEQISTLFDKSEPVFKRESNRGYHTYTGLFKGKRVSVVAFGIGFAMVDFLVRELRTINKGPLTFIELGSAPTGSDIKIGTPVVVNDAVAFQIDFENFDKDIPYHIFKKPVPANAATVAAIENGLKTAKIEYVNGRVASNPSFCAGINAPTPQSGGIGAFNFKTDGLLELLEKECGKIASFEMDAYPLLWTSLRATEKDSIRSAVVSVVGADLKGNVISEDELNKKLLAVAPVLLEQLGNLQA
ncbi:hypothetical protein TRFO_27925 [Tritrichomonas foetus]|uniref:Nucleoside phosphorylase domain-containing protein n=1 Tax=Tritrichomonas foetus TaxID=1144522 RepID=A0A1J4JZY7_9EUKA|nr:hypothetical protein TRFO_27925 [Tritrichomonas foetus]|eukprot:OHT04547.1 hypothetical protein TRFO_27925 [Tritrichomonas foetus]